MVLCSSHQKCTHPESQRGKTPTRPRLSSDHKLPPGTSVRSRRRERWRNSVCLEETAGATAQGSEGAWGLGEEGPGWGAWRLRGPAGPLQHELPLRTPHCASVRPWGWDERGKRRDGWPCHLCNFSVNLKQV